MADRGPNSVGVEQVAQVALQSGIPFWRAPWEFAVHGIIGTSIFAIIAALAVLLDVSVRWLETYQISGVIVFGLQTAEYALFGTDLYLFGVFLWRTAKRTIKDL